MTRKQKRLLSRIVSAAILLSAALVCDRYLGERLNTVQLLCIYLPAYLAAGIDVLKRAFKNIVGGQIFDENFLMALATLGALAIGFLPEGEPEFAEAVLVMVFYQIGELFQSIAVGKSRRSIAALMDIRPDTARVVRNGAEIEVSPDTVAVGELISVRPGERIPLDGTVTEGCSDLNTVALTGEALPRAVKVGDMAISGTTNLWGALRIRVEKCYSDSTVAHILSLVENAAAKKAKTERFITRFARYYTPFVVISALLLAFLPPLFLGTFSASLPMWLARGLTFLVISCPCALVISVPLSFFGGIGGASRHGILIKGSMHLEQLAKAKTVIFDKTGTLTKGTFTVTSICPTSGTADALLLLAAAAEQHSNHPIARALLAATNGTLPQAREIREVAGRGIMAQISGQEIAVGNEALMHDVGATHAASQESGTLVHVAKDGTYLGHIAISDSLKPTAKQAILALRDAGVTHTVILTGDRDATARTVAQDLGINAWHAELLPTDKVTQIEALLAAPHRGTVAFAGDGINDAPVLSRADVGIAMGALGSDAAIEAADVVLMDDDPRKIASAIKMARRTLRIVRQNIVLTLGVKAGVLLCSALGSLGTWQMPIAIFADVGVLVLAILNAMRSLKTATVSKK